MYIKGLFFAIHNAKNILDPDTRHICASNKTRTDFLEIIHRKETNTAHDNKLCQNKWHHQIL